jgi:hypothetical protein
MLSSSIILAMSVFIFVLTYSILVYIKPSVMFYEDGTIREFGIGYKNKTVFPIWLVAIILGALSYLFVLYGNYLS